MRGNLLLIFIFKENNRIEFFKGMKTFIRNNSLNLIEYFVEIFIAIWTVSRPMKAQNIRRHISTARIKRPMERKTKQA